MDAREAKQIRMEWLTGLRTVAAEQRSRAGMCRDADPGLADWYGKGAAWREKLADAMQQAEDDSDAIGAMRRGECSLLTIGHVKNGCEESRLMWTAYSTGEEPTEGTDHDPAGAVLALVARVKGETKA